MKGDGVKESIFKRAAKVITEPVGGARVFGAVVAAGALAHGAVYAFTEASEIVAGISAFTTWEMGYCLAHYHRENRGVVSSVARLALCGAVAFMAPYYLCNIIYEPQMIREAKAATDALRVEAMRHPWQEGREIKIAGMSDRATVLFMQNIPDVRTGKESHFAVLHATYSVRDWSRKTKLPLASVLTTGTRPGAYVKKEEGETQKNLPLPHDLRRGRWRTVKIADAASQKTL